MQIILLEKVANLGQLGDIVKVKDGYARNFLIPTGKARRATEANIAEFQQRREDLEQKQNEILTAAQEKAARLEGLVLQVAQKAGVDGRLFGSVTSNDVSAALEGQGFEVAKASVRLSHGPLKHIGEHEVGLDLHTDVKVQIKVIVVGE
ncbi:MAG: 50S ribosomal protein L9 [Burkholderiales bacterium]|nr:50S ribosomal protein L9 [Burkholderiales bacterium]